MARPFEAVVVVGSQGARQSFEAMAGSLPATFPSAIVFDLHRGECNGLTEELLRRRCALPVSPAEHGHALDPARVYLAPHDRQLVIDSERRMRILGPVEGVGHRFADALLTSAAEALGPRLIAVVLSGRLDGVSHGLREVSGHGGRVIVEDPAVAAAPSMPSAALATGCVDFALPPQRLGYALVALCAATGAAELFRVRLNAGVSS